MAFGQPSGPPAPKQKIKELLSQLQAAGHSDFRDARGPMGFNQRQAGGKFTRAEAEAFITQLNDAAEFPNSEPAAQQHASFQKKSTNLPARSTPEQRLLKKLSDDDLAAELQNRGWVVMKP
jgi:hypothetical protein